MKYLGYVLGLALFSLGCQTKPKETANTQLLCDQVMDIHDEVMPHMGEINRLKRELKNTLGQIPDLTIEKRQKIEHAISLLDSADFAMMDWMHRFDPLPDSSATDQAHAYLKSEMVKIQDVKELINAALTTAQEAKQ